MAKNLESTMRHSGVSDTFTVSATSAQSAVVSANIWAVRIVSTTACWYMVGANPTATAGDNSHYLPAGVIEYIRIAPTERIAVIQAAAGGTFCMSEMTQ